jgi:regulator of sirC expression with transglutaminase-like and TPR domain
VVETARRAGLTACGLALPRHFMSGLMLHRSPGSAATDDGADLFFIDAFNAQVLAAEEVAQKTGLPLEELAEHLTPAQPDAVLCRMLTNLRGSYLARQDPVCCMRVLSRLLLLKPREAALHLERAHLKSAVGDATGALVDAENGLRLARDPDEKEAAERILEKLTRISGWVH